MQFLCVSKKVRSQTKAGRPLRCDWRKEGRGWVDILGQMVSVGRPM